MRRTKHRENGAVRTENRPDILRFPRSFATMGFPRLRPLGSLAMVLVRVFHEE